MKRFLLCLLLAGVISSLSAQTQTVSVYLPLVTGTGVNQGDNNFFYNLVYRELDANDFVTIGRSAPSSDFSLICALTPVGRNEVTSVIEYRFDLFLQNNRTGEVLSEQRYRYSSLENVNLVIRQMLDNVFKIIKPVPPPVYPVFPVLPVYPAPQPAAEPVQPPPQPVADPVQPAPQPVADPIQPAPQPVDEPVPPVQAIPTPVLPIVTPDMSGDWRERWVFLGLSAFWNPRIYSRVVEELGIKKEKQVPYLGNYILGFYPEIRFLDSVSLETGLGISSDWILYPEQDPDNYRDLLLEIPLLVKIVLTPGDVFLLQPYSGVNFNISLFGATEPPPVSWVVGYQHGVKAGPGAFLFDFRFSMDLGKSTLEARPSNDMDPPDYQRYSVSLGVGYKIGILPKR